ncbi:DUF6708 domain-containing protein [Pseudomonas sp. HR96]|uniref:DUF6708 domain-containing protein n=1 Tax=Pseudomonas sp. HR96 TaxID=1027966 RepID=UPI002A75F8E2|nr:DUF6708 domain-containing protein [Pseudomonas sp. HR96]WPP01496.1 DUF6708 domain-containing protein [Pseudomonas sp. HR96]
MNKFIKDPGLPQHPRGWEYDLPSPNEPVLDGMVSSFINNPPSYVDPIYMELACSTVSARGVGACCAIVWVMFCGAILLFIFSEMVSDGFYSLQLMCALLLGLGAAAWVFTCIWRLDTEAPRDEPVRFNRVRRKVYVYRFLYSARRPFSRRAWGVSARVYEWDCLRAEYCTVYGPMGAGGLIQTVYLAAVDSATGKVVDRFVFAHSRREGEMYWAMAKLYMQEGPESVPKFDNPPQGWDSEVQLDKVARRFAPEVDWPEAMDIESRTIP